MAHHYDELMSLALDGRLTTQERSALDAHLAVCAECRARWAAFQQVDRLMSSAAQAMPEPGFSSRFAARLAQEGAQRRARQSQVLAGQRIAAGFGAAAAAVAALALILVPAALALWYLVGNVVGGGPALIANGLELAARWLVTLNALSETSRSTAEVIARSGGSILLGYLFLLVLVVAAWISAMRHMRGRWQSISVLITFLH